MTKNKIQLILKDKWIIALCELLTLIMCILIFTKCWIQNYLKSCTTCCFPDSSSSLTAIHDFAVQKFK